MMDECNHNSDIGNILSPPKKTHEIRTSPANLYHVIHIYRFEPVEESPPCFSEIVPQMTVLPYH